MLPTRFSHVEMSVHTYALIYVHRNTERYGSQGPIGFWWANIRDVVADALSSTTAGRLTPFFQLFSTIIYDMSVELA